MVTIGLCPTFRGAYRKSSQNASSSRLNTDNSPPGQTLRSVKLSQGSLPAGQRVFVDLAKANLSVRTCDALNDGHS